MLSPEFCTPFPQELIDQPQLVAEHLPLTIRYNDFTHQGTSLRDARARVVTVEFKVAALKLDPHGEKKFIQLLGRRYDEATGVATILADRCPTRRQNRDYAHYLITALYHESMRVEEWERAASQRSEGDFLEVRPTGYRVPTDVDAYKREAMARLGLAPTLGESSKMEDRASPS